jgi:peroxiredoxin Q/BCP
MILSLALAVLLPAETEVMKLKVGDPAPAFTLLASTGRTVKLSEFKGRKKVVLAFFPKAFTGGCTQEMSGFRDQQKVFDDAGAQILGISMDRPETQKKFAESLKLTFPILADKGGETAKAYGVKGALWANRTTFIIDDTGTITAIFEGKDALDPALSAAATKSKVSKP